jgi:hypothetical protein
MNPKLTAVWIRCNDHATALYPQKLALISLTIGDRSLGGRYIRLRTEGRWACFVCLFVWDAMMLAHLVQQPLFDLLHKPRLMDDAGCAAVSRMIGRRNRSTRKRTCSSSTLSSTKLT